MWIGLKGIFENQVSMLSLSIRTLFQWLKGWTDEGIISIERKNGCEQRTRNQQVHSSQGLDSNQCYKPLDQASEYEGLDKRVEGCLLR